MNKVKKVLMGLVFLSMMYLLLVMSFIMDSGLYHG